MQQAETPFVEVPTQLPYATLRNFDFNRRTGEPVILGEEPDRHHRNHQLFLQATLLRIRPDGTVKGRGLTLTGPFETQDTSQWTPEERALENELIAQRLIQYSGMAARDHEEPEYATYSEHLVHNPDFLEEVATIADQIHTCQRPLDYLYRTPQGQLVRESQLAQT
jgi:hypothetical protein